MAFAQERIPSWRSIVEPDEKMTSPIDQRRTDELARLLEEGETVRGEGVRQEYHGVYAVIHGLELHSIPWIGPHQGRHHMFVGTSPPQGHSMYPSPCREAQGPGPLGLPVHRQNTKSG
jgi:hypothetical protein